MVNHTLQELKMASRSTAFSLLCLCVLLASAVDGIASNCGCDRAALPSVDSLGLPPQMTEGDAITELQCTLGCNSEASVGTRGNRINVRECRSACADAHSKFLTDDNCTRACDSLSCISGCSIYEQQRPTAVKTSAETAIAATPSAPVLVLNEEGGRPAEYSFEVPDLVTRSLVNTGYGFIFRIDNPMENITTYIPMVATAEPMALSLVAFMCLKISVSYSVLSRQSHSDYSPSTTLCIQGTPGPSQNISVLVQEDFRTDYSEHAVLNIAWERPANFEYVSHYSLVISSIDEIGKEKCRNQHLSITDIDKISTGIVIQSEDTRQLPIFPCPYQLALISHPSIRESGKATKYFQVTVSYSLRIHCEALYDVRNGTYTLRVEWNPDLPAPIIEAASSFMIEIFILFPTNLVSELFYRCECFTNSTFCAVPGLSPIRHEERSNYTLTVTPKRNRHLNVPRRRLLEREECTLAAPPHSPSRMKSISVGQQVFNLSDKLLDVNVRWVQPEYHNGRLLGYELRVAKEPIYNNDDGSYIATNLAYVLEDIKPSSTFLRVRAIIFWYEPEALTNTLHFQMRARNEFNFSDWSQPVQLRLSSPDVVATSETSTTMMTMMNKSSKDYIYVISGVVLSSTVLILILIFLLIYVGYKRRARRKSLETGSINPDRASNIYHYVEPFVPSFSKTVAEVDQWEVRLATVHLCKEQKLQGYFGGKTYKGKIESQSGGNGLQHKVLAVAVKTLEDYATTEDKKDFFNEIDVMKQVSGSTDMRKTFVVNMVGCVTIDEPLLLLLEHVHHSDLLSYMRENRRQEQATCSTNVDGVHSRPRTPVIFEVGEMEKRDLWRFAWQIAAGMDFLSGLRIVHGSLACRNILVGEGKNVKISNFIMSTQPEKNVIDSKSLRWAALESLLHHTFTTLSDVWSYGVVLWELSTMGAFPYPTVPDEKLTLLLKNDFRLEKPEHTTLAMYELMLRCWNEDPHSRPSFSKLCKKMEPLLSSCIEKERLHVSTAEFVTG